MELFLIFVFPAIEIVEYPNIIFEFKTIILRFPL